MRYLGKTFGAGAGMKEAEAYKLLIKYYLGGDKVIDIIGFSRGAVMAMQFAAMIKKYGIPKNESGVTVNSLYLSKSDDHYCPEIRFLGLFDPVPGPAGMTAPSNIPDIVQKTAIAYSINEQRNAFTPSIPEGKNIVMQGFPGGHADVGGGYKDAGLSNEAMRWMINQGGTPFSMPSMDDYHMTNERVSHQEDQWYWYLFGFGSRNLPPVLQPTIPVTP